MTIREQLDILYGLRVDLVVVGGQAGVLRQAVEFSHDLDILFRPTPENAERLREAVEARIRHLVLRGDIEVDEVVLALCLDPEILRLPEVAGRAASLAQLTSQPLLQARFVVHAPEQTSNLQANASLNPIVATLLGVTPDVRARIVDHPARFAALLAKLPLLLPPEGYRMRPAAADVDSPPMPR